MQTTSIQVMNLCVSCENRCRYCLLSYDGKINGVPYEQSQDYARWFHGWLQENRPELSFVFGFGYSMDHPDLLCAIDFLRRIASPTGEFLQFDGMRFRNEKEIRELLKNLLAHGIRLIDLTFYGTEDYHDRFAARRGDYRYMMEILKIANETGLPVHVSIPINHENAGQMEELLSALHARQTQGIRLFVPHGEGRGETLEDIRFSAQDDALLSQAAKAYFPSNRFRPEKDWLQETELPVFEKRALAVTLTKDNVDFFEKLPFDETIAYLEKLDEDYHAALPDFRALGRLYGDASGEKFYSYRDLLMKYQRQHIRENHLHLHDVHDERQCFIRRY